MAHNYHEARKEIWRLLQDAGLPEDQTDLWAMLMASYQRIEPLSSISWCPKRGLGGMLFCKHGEPLSEGLNVCAPSGPGEEYWGAGYLTEDDCPRASRDKSAGKGWDLCNPVHCEVMLLLNARRSIRGTRSWTERLNPAVLGEVTRSKLEEPEGREYLKNLFTEEERTYIRGGLIVFTGVGYSCEACQRVAFEDFGISSIVIMPPEDDLWSGGAVTILRHEQEPIALRLTASS